MVIMKTNDYVAVPGFQWLCYGNTVGGYERPETAYYNYNETSDYMPVFIELDTTANPLEIGAFINDSCVGATTVTPEDTLVLIPAYTEGLSGEIYFEEYNGTQKSGSIQIKEYWVKNNRIKVREKRAIHTQEKNDYYVVSFKQIKEQTCSDTEQYFSIYPNPVNNALTIIYNIENDAMINISVFDSYGRYITTIINSSQSSGVYNMQWNLRDNNGIKLNKGLYIINLKIDDDVVSKKVVIN